MTDPSVREGVSHAPVSILRLASGRCIAIYDPQTLIAVVAGDDALVADRAVPQRRSVRCSAQFRRWCAFGAIVLATWVATGIVAVRALQAIFGP